MARATRRQGLRHRQPSARPPAGHRDRAARPNGTADLRRGRATSTRRTPAATSSEDFPEWEPCHRALSRQRDRRLRERRRRDRRGHRQARDVRRLPVALGEGRRLHHPTRRDARPNRPSSASSRGRHDEGESARRRRALQPAEPFRLPRAAASGLGRQRLLQLLGGPVAFPSRWQRRATRPHRWRRSTSSSEARSRSSPTMARRLSALSTRATSRPTRPAPW